MHVELNTKRPPFLLQIDAMKTTNSYWIYSLSYNKCHEQVQFDHCTIAESYNIINSIRAEDVKGMLGLEELVEQLARVNGEQVVQTFVEER